MSATKNHPLRVIQWTTGNIGRRSLHAIIGRPDMELVGYTPGRTRWEDAAELSGWPEPTGVKDDDSDSLLALRPDACCYNPLWPSVDELVRLLESGINVCSSAAWITGGKRTPQDLQRILDTCERAARRFLAAARTRDDEPGRHGAKRVLERVDEIRITESVDSLPTNRRKPRRPWVSRKTPTHRAGQECATRK